MSVARNQRVAIVKRRTTGCRMGIIPILICIELNSILGSGMIFACGVVYGFMALGKKADRYGSPSRTDRLR